MDLRWLLYSAYTHVLGYPKEDPTMFSSNGEPVQVGVVKDLKKLSNEEGTPNSMQQQQHHLAGFQMPLHYPRYKKIDYEKMEEWKVDVLLKEYGLNFKGTLDEKRAYAMGAFLWPDQV